MKWILNGLLTVTVLIVVLTLIGTSVAEPLKKETYDYWQVEGHSISLCLSDGEIAKCYELPRQKIIELIEIDKIEVESVNKANKLRL